MHLIWILTCVHVGMVYCFPSHNEATQQCGNHTCPFWSTCYNNTHTRELECGDCMAGFLAPNCTDRNECTLLGHDPCAHFGTGTCVNSIGGFDCTCLVGWTGPKCQYEDQNVTALDRACLPGYVIHVYNDTNGDCQDINECSNSAHDQFKCQEHQYCANTVGSYVCKCHSGWKGVSCSEDIDECTTTSACGNRQRCINTLGSFTCEYDIGLESANSTINKTRSSSETSALVNNHYKIRLDIVLSAVFGSLAFVCGLVIAAVIFRKQSKKMQVRPECGEESNVENC